jgi:hypothetical protein
MDALRNCHDTPKINRVRINLQATTVTDITNAEGTYINEFVWQKKQQERGKPTKANSRVAETTKTRTKIMERVARRTTIHPKH